MGLKDLDISKNSQVLPAVEGFKARHITLERYSALRRDAKLHQNRASRDTKHVRPTALTYVSWSDNCSQSESAWAGRSHGLEQHDYERQPTPMSHTGKRSSKRTECPSKSLLIKKSTHFYRRTRVGSVA